ncbi:MAG: exodeoxyribonuclease VII small subunit, partial [Rhodospirillales bacterium]
MAKSPAKDIPDDIKAMSFEDAMAELEMIVQRLEQGKGTLEDSIHSYERGAHLRRY